MKLSRVALSLIIATSGLSSVGMSNAIAAEGGLEFNGSFRAGTLSSKADDYQRATWGGASKEKVGRLGIEADNDFGFGLAKTWTLDDDKSVKIAVGFDDDGEDSYSATDFPGAYVEYKGITETGLLWGGRRDVAKTDHYIFMTDFFYVDYSGTGMGIEDVEIGPANVTLAYVVSDRAENDEYSVNRDLDTNNMMHAVILGLDFGDIRIDMAGKYIKDNRSYWGTSTDPEWDDPSAHTPDTGTLTDYAEKGMDVTITYTMDDFFGIGNGFSKIIGQGGWGLGSQNLLGSTLTSYSAYRPGSVYKGGEYGEAVIANNYGDDTSARMLLWGGLMLENGVGIFPSLQGQYNDHYFERTYDFWWSAMARVTIPMGYDHFYLQSEVGYAYNNWNGGTWYEKKITIAPTFVMGTGTGPSPEVRLLASYLPEAEDGDGDFIVGVQADVWW